MGREIEFNRWIGFRQYSLNPKSEFANQDKRIKITNSNNKLIHFLKMRILKNSSKNKNNKNEKKGLHQMMMKTMKIRMLTTANSYCDNMKK